VITERELEQIVREVMRSMGQGTAKAAVVPGKVDPRRDYPLAEKRPDLIRTPRGKTLDDITLEKIMSGEITAEDLRITPEALELQAQIAEAAGRSQIALNFRRAAEMTRIPDQRLLEMYNALRPNRSTAAELTAIADELEQKYGAKLCAAHVREACEVYGRREILRQE